MCICKECKETKEVIENEQNDRLKQVLENLIKKLNPILIIPVSENISKEDVKTQCKIEIKGIELNIIPRLNIVPIPTLQIKDIKVEKEFVKTDHSAKECELKEEK